MLRVISLTLNLILHSHLCLSHSSALLVTSVYIVPILMLLDVYGSYCDYFMWCVLCTVVILTCFVIYRFVYVLVLLCVGVLVIYVLVLVCFVLFVLCFCIVSFVYIICFVCISVRTTATIKIITIISHFPLNSCSMVHLSRACYMFNKR